MGSYIKNLFIFIMLAAGLLTACGRSSSGTPTKDSTTLIFPPDPKPTVTPDITALGDCSTLPGQWEFRDLATGKHVTPPVATSSAFQKKFVMNWGGTTTAYAVWDVEAGYEPVWNEGRTVHFGTGFSFATHGRITSIALTGKPANMTVLVGTSEGLVVADLVRDNSTWQIKQQKTVEAMGPVRSVAATTLILEKNGPYVPMAFVVASESVFVARLDDLRSGGGCVSVVYQAKDHLVDSKEPANKRTFRPVKVVAQHSFSAFLTASRLPEEIANAAQFKSLLQNEWGSFQSTAYLIDVARETPVEPLITTLGDFDRFFASDIGMTETSIYLFGNRYKGTKPVPTESGIATYGQLVGTPVATGWTAVPSILGGDFRMGRFDTNLANAFIRGLDMAVKVENFLSPPTQQKWTAWKGSEPFDYVRGVTYRKVIEDNKIDPSKPKEVDELAVETPQFVPGGPLTRNWNQTLAYATPAYTAIGKLINATATDFDYLGANGGIVHQHVQDDGQAVFPLFENSKDTGWKSPHIFHVGSYLFYVRHGTGGPTMYVFPDTILGTVNISTKSTDLVQGNIGLIRVDVIDTSKKDCVAGNAACTTTAIAAFENMKGTASNYRVDDIRMVSNPKLPNLQHFVMLVHSWNGVTNDYRVIALQANLSETDKSYRRMSIQACSDLVDPGNNYSWDSSYGNPDEQPRFLAPLTVSAMAADKLTYAGYFQHFSSTYNVWSLQMDVTTDVLADEGKCLTAGTLTPLTDSAVSESLAAAMNGNNLLGLHSNGLVRWKADAKTTQYIDIGNIYLGGPVTVQKGKLIQAGTQFITQMETSNGFHSTVLFGVDSGGESCPACQFTDIAATGNLIFSAQPERGIEFYNFSGN